MTVRRRAITLTLALLLLVSAWPGTSTAFAHGLGQSTDLPIPRWLFVFGAGAAVLLSFIPISQLGDERRAPRGYPRFDLLRVGPLRALLAARPFLFGLRLLSVALFVLVVLSGLLGRQDPGSNFAPTFVWITWWVGFGFFTAFVGNLWPLVNPWKVLFGWADGLVRRLGAKGGLELGAPYPASLGVWPAVALYAAFVWFENVLAGSFEPLSVAVLTLGYSALTWGGMVVYGKDAWLRNGEVFSVFFGVLGRFAPTEVRVKKREGRRGAAPARGTRRAA